METLLIIENNYMMRLFLVNFFSQEFNVEAVETPREALNLINKNLRPSFVITDYYGNNALEQNEFKELLQTMNWQNIPNLVLTDEDKSNQRIEALKLGSKDVVSKPFNPVELQLRVQGPLGYNKVARPQRVA